ncbi:urease accessory protein UreF [Kineococcus terrestris]|uniref:urease accessory protein UreF n=1 Tax=Kineococcus terrestris TaxID=2044856 RepID=UPI0034DB6359
MSAGPAGGARLLAAMALGDSAFPSGALAFSSGLEAATRTGAVTGEDDLADFVEEQLRHRWHTGDRVLLARCAREPGWEGALLVDAEAERLAVVDVLRRGSRTAGLALLGTFAALGSAPAARLRAAALAGRSPGHLVTAQAVCLRDAGLGPAEVEAVCCWSLVAQLTSAAVRLGVVGHLGAQRVTRRAVAVAGPLLATAPPREPWTGTALADVLVGLPAGDGRLFTT